MGYGLGQTAAVVEQPDANAADADIADPFVLSPLPPRGVEGAEADDLDPDVVEDVGDEIALLAAHLHAGMYPYLLRVAWYDRVEAWKRSGHRSCAYWLAVRTKNDLVTARDHVRVARKLEDLREIGAAMGRGALSYSQVRALTRVAKPETEADLLELAEHCTAAQLERVVRAWKKDRRLDEEERERLRHESRRFSVVPDGDGMYDVRGKLTADGAAVLMRAIDAASDALYRERRPLPAPPEVSVREAAQRRADALVLLAERGMAAGFGSEDPKTLSGTRAERYQVLLHVEPETLSAGGEPGMSEFEDGTRASAEASRRIACDCGLVRVERGPEGEVLNVGRKTRTIPNALRRALEVRDRGCRFPGCGLRFTDGHHVVHWADGGETSLANTILLCGHHHRLVHEGGWGVEWWGPDRTLAFRDPKGQVHTAIPRKRPRVGRDPLAALVGHNRRRGVDPDPWTAGARWEFERDIPDEVLFRATEAAL